MDIKDIKLEDKILKYDNSEINLPEGCVFDGQILKPELLRDAFKFLRQELKFKNINIILPIKNFIIKQAFYPDNMPLSEIKQALSYELDKYFIELKDYSSFNPNLRDDLVYEVKYDANNILMTAAAEHKFMSGILIEAERAGLKVKSIEPENYNYFDLRTPAYKNSELKRRKLNLDKFIALAALILFLGANLFYIFKAYKNILRLENLISIEEAQAPIRAAQLEELKAERTRQAAFKRTLNFIEDQPPVLEVLRLLEMNLIDGIKINSISVKQDIKDKIYKAEINASSSNGKLITKFLENLNASADRDFVNKIYMPRRVRENFIIILELKMI
ncbi:MAG: hypothetical protein IJG62_06635 [Synergistaceae bacterium]|nr:hypothetical protein [Synergistaceae bacterium]MBQ9895748.1 hypothetical protein [Synergistaceae bacterium]MBR0097809.1 hypothetical protein [Synergistaceae bacterium]MBR0221458.1 hypothetical protein [Synergistaceae bacterium]